MAREGNKASTFVIGAEGEVGGFDVLLKFGGQGGQKFVTGFGCITVGIVEKEHAVGLGRLV